jgi:hypothetical protein
LASYIALGAEGCTFDGNVFANFAYSANASGGAVAIQADQILLTPSFLAPGTTRFNFSAPWSVGRDQTQNSIISYSAVLPCGDTRPAQLELILVPGHIGGLIGAVRVNESTNVGNLSIFDRCLEVCQIQTTDSLNFSPVSVLIISDHVNISGGTGGASLKEFDTQLNLCYLCP